ncbi:MAG: glycerol-3-phosphate 1-O-acyltransferase PlsY [Oscillospiraceae bacterium]|nr:glycerol-3-phosphate 1-O-acyltransferase PlsY [Oscillospiraceae bacterium]MCI9668352.1 glycerol-3-phosphate 1-O-acyltransferase PlsY [Oscillospiraceae bacterium]
MFEGKFFLAAALTAVLSYLIGSVSFAIIVSRLGAQEDVRNYGSGNAGMTNILRNYGKKMAAFTAVGDFGKALVAVALGRLIFRMLGVEALDGGYIAGLFALLGHLFPVYFGFRGGKGVLTSLGVMLMLNPLVFILCMIPLLPIVFLTKIVSLTVCIGYIVFPIVTLVIDTFVRHLPSHARLFDFFFVLCLAFLGMVMHRANIVRLLHGTEYKFGQKKPDEPGEGGH